MWKSFCFCNHCHPLYVFTYERWNTHHSDPGEVHKQSDVVGIKSGEPTLTCEVFDDEFHKWNIPVLQELERKHPAQFTMIFGLDIWFIMLFADILPFVPPFPYLSHSSCFCNNGW